MEDRLLFQAICRNAKNVIFLSKVPTAASPRVLLASFCSDGAAVILEASLGFL